MPQDPSGPHPTQASAGNRLAQAALALAVGTGIGAVLASQVLRLMSALVCPADDPEGQVRILRPDASFVVHFKAAFFTGLVLASPVVVYQLIRLMAPNPGRRERWLLGCTLPFIPLSLGAAAYNWLEIVQPVLRFLGPQSPPGDPGPVRPVYIVAPSLNLLIGFGFAWIVPVVMAFVVKEKILPWQALLAICPILGLLFLALTRSSPYPWTPGMLAVTVAPVLVLYCVGVALARVVAPMPAPATRSPRPVAGMTETDA